MILPQREYQRLRRAAENDLPELPPADASGNYPALETLDAMLARDIIRHRRTMGLTQAELARRAGVRPETLNRLERGKFAPSIRTVEKIDRALKAIEAAQTRARPKRKPAKSGQRLRKHK